MASIKCLILCEGERKLGGSDERDFGTTKREATRTVGAGGRKDLLYTYAAVDDVLPTLNVLVQIEETSKDAVNVASIDSWP